MKNKLETQKLSKLIFAFSGLTLSVTAFLVGSNVGSNLPLYIGMIAIIFGNLVLAVYAGLIGLIGYKNKESSVVISRPVFGNYGQIVTSGVVVIFLMGFVSVYATLFGELINTLFPLISPYLGSLIFIALITISTIKGFSGISGFSKIGVPLLGIFVFYGLYKVNNLVGLSDIVNIKPVGKLAFGLVMSQVISVWSSAATFSSDINRFAQKSKHVLITTFVAFGLTAVLEIIAFILALGTGEANLVAILKSLNLVVPALFIYLLLMWTSGQTLLYSFSLAFNNIYKLFIKDKKEISNSKWVILGSVLALIGSFIMLSYGVTASFNKFLLTIGIAIPAIGGILIAHYHIVYRGKTNHFGVISSFRLNAFISWGIGILIAKYINLGIPALNGMLSASIVYIILGFYFKEKENI